MHGLPNHQVNDVLFLEQFRKGSKVAFEHFLYLGLKNGFSNILFLDHLYRYGAAARRGAIRSVNWSNDSLPIFVLTIREHDPAFTCTRRAKGQITCPELSCEQCPTDSVNLTSLANHVVCGTVGAITTHNVHLFDRHQLLSQCHGLVLPSDVNWTEMEHTPTVLDYRNRELRVRLNLGSDWGRNLVGKNKIFKGFKPGRRYLQVCNLWKLFSSANWATQNLTWVDN